MVVHYNPLTKEPYLQLPAPCANIIMTPHREHQIEEVSAAMTEFLNDSRVHSWLQGPPYPFLPEHGVEWVKMKIAEQEEVVSTLQKEFETPKSQQGDSLNIQEEPVFFDKFPFLCIREVTERDPATGAPLQDVWIGDFNLTRYAFYELQPNSPELALAQKQNKDLPAGHKDIVWDYLSPTQQSRGVMSAAVRTVVQDWAIPRMNLHHLKSSYFVGNTGSSRVLEKNNFEEIGTFKDWAPASPAKGLGPMSIVVMEWKGLL
ncbi:Acyl-CoA N-acyltransferase [Penicillium expansum]|nr:Acyl-CoA N-acyltransferase [Penicillium expansum]